MPFLLEVDEKDALIVKTGEYCCLCMPKVSELIHITNGLQKRNLLPSAAMGVVVCNLVVYINCLPMMTCHFGFVKSWDQRKL